MAKAKKTQPQQYVQPYDTSLKGLVDLQAREILPMFLPGVTYEGTVNVEIIRPVMRVDKAYVVKYRGEEHILHLEFESGADDHMPLRLLAYNAVLHLDHQIPVISMIIYPFKVKIAESPLRVKSGGEELITFHYLILPLFKLEAEQYVREHIACMYPLLPTMQGVNHELMRQAMDELAELYRDDEVTLAQQFVWMEILLERTEMIPPQEKRKIREDLSMYDRLWEENPRVQQIRAESLAKGLAEGRVEGEIQAMQRILVNIVSTRFPDLAGLAEQEAARLKTADNLALLIQKIATAPDEKSVRCLLSPPVA